MAKFSSKVLEWIFILFNYHPNSKNIENSLHFLFSQHIHNGTSLLATVMERSCFFSPALFTAWQVYIPVSFSTIVVKTRSPASWWTLPVVGIRTLFLSHQIWGSGIPRGATQVTRCSLLAMTILGSNTWEKSSISMKKQNVHFRIEQCW